MVVSYLKRILYFIYYLQKQDKRRFRKFLAYAKQISSKSYPALITDIVLSSFRYNMSLLDYFYYRFYMHGKDERKLWAGSGFMYEYQLIMNPKKSRDVLQNKISFLNSYAPFFKRGYADIKQLLNDSTLVRKMLDNPSGKLVMKASGGQVGAEVEVIRCSEYTPESLLSLMESKNFDLLEDYIIQHPDLMDLSPSGLNTVRIITQLIDGRVEFPGARLRISVNSYVDNLAAGNLAAPVDIETGLVYGPGIYSDITREEADTHPVTGQKIKGFRVPYWNETIDLARAAALYIPENRSVGWDIAVTELGPELIEGNHNWCKLLWQLPVKKGLKYELEKYLNWRNS
ncbi:MAG TPA: hexapeptide transferase [Bacteroidetes bacterium]|nr:hexapeptide transferase [Bacteroidota bacterium]